MDIPVTTVSFVYGLLAVAGIAFLVWFAIMAVAGRFSDTAADGLDQAREVLEPYALWIAFGVALLAVLGSLYFSEVAHYTPCRLCWFQRIFMYPLVLILGIAAWRRDVGIRIYAIPMAVIGGVISAYHYTLQWFPELEPGSCDPSAPCTLAWFREFGFISIPLLALVAFILIIAVLLVPFRDSEPPSAGEESAHGPPESPAG